MTCVSTWTNWRGVKTWPPQSCKLARMDCSPKGPRVDLSITQIKEVNIWQKTKNIKFVITSYVLGTVLNVFSILPKEKLTSFFSKESHSRHSRPCRPWNLCDRYSAPLCSVEAARDNAEWLDVAVPQWNIVDWNSQWSWSGPLGCRLHWSSKKCHGVKGTNIGKLLFLLVFSVWKGLSSK
jgi:hypothetical protein